jgi:enoyl-CoA hydratase
MEDLIVGDRPRPGVYRITLNRPDKLNALTQVMRALLIAEIETAGADPEVSIIVLRGSGRAFSVGVDVAPADDSGAGYLGEHSAARDHARLEEGTVRLLLAIWNCRVPVITQVHGYALGMATLIAQVSDMIFAAEDATFGWPKLPLGGGMLSPLWAYQIGAHRAKELSMTVGSTLSGARAAEWGAINRALPAIELEEYVLGIAARSARLGRELLHIKKSAVNQVLERGGYSETIRMAATWDAIAHQASVVDATRDLIAANGMKLALRTWAPESEDRT